MKVLNPECADRDDRHNKDADLADRAVRSNVVINSLNTHGVAASSFGSVDTPPPLLKERQQFEMEQAYADEAFMENLADSTGATVFRNGNVSQRQRLFRGFPAQGRTA